MQYNSILFLCNLKVQVSNYTIRKGFRTASRDIQTTKNTLSARAKNSTLQSLVFAQYRLSAG